MPLTARRVATASPGTHEDGRGLRLVVSKGGSRRFVLRYQLKGKRRDMGLGGWPAMSLADAREKADELRRMIKRGIDPLTEISGAVQMSVSEAIEATIESRKSGWRSPTQERIWRNSLNEYVVPALGAKDVSQVTVADVLAVLRAFWTDKPETASRVRSRLEIVLDYAGTLGARDGENPCRWKGNLENLLPPPKKVQPVVHHPALPFRDVAAFMQDLLLRKGIAARCLAFTVLTAARSGEARKATWEEVDLERRVWVIPGNRMKAGSEHEVPLTDATLAMMGQAGTGLVFPSDMKPGHPLTDVGMSKILKRMKLPVTVHGFRSSFRDWAGELHPEFAKEVVERCLAHGPQDRTEAAYARGNLLDRRREVMKAWAEYVMSATKQTTKVDER